LTASLKPHSMPTLCLLDPTDQSQTLFSMLHLGQTTHYCASVDRSARLFLVLYTPLMPSERPVAMHPAFQPRHR